MPTLVPLYSCSLLPDHEWHKEPGISDPGKFRAPQLKSPACEQRGRTTSLKKLDQFVMLYAPNATFMTSGKRVTGRAAICELTKEAMDSFTSDIALRSITTECSGDFAYDSGDYHETLISNSDGSKASVSGDDLTIYHRAIDHKWLITRQVWTKSFETVAWSGDHTSIK